MFRTPVCCRILLSYPIVVSQLSFNFLCLLLLYSIYLSEYIIYTHDGYEVRKDTVW
jgi:hypothetical protein